MPGGHREPMESVRFTRTQSSFHPLDQTVPPAVTAPTKNCGWAAAGALTDNP